MAYVTTKQFNEQLSKIGNKTLYTNDTVDLDIDNLSKVSNCDKLSFTDLMNILNYKIPKVTLTSNLSTLIYELGISVSGGITLTANVTKGTSEIVKVEFFKDEVSVSSITIDVENGGSFTYADGTTINANTDYKVEITTEDGTIVKDELKIRFYNPYYYGVTSKSIDDITETDIKSMTKDISDKIDKTYSFTSNNERVVIAYDKNYGLLTSIEDQNKFENINSFEYKEITVGTTQYYVYETTTSFYCNNFKYNFKY